VHWFALRAAQKGGKHPDAKPLKGFKGAGVLEIISDFDGDSFRAVYTVRMKGVLYVLHAFQKKSKSGIKTPLPEIEKIESRLKDKTQKQLTRREKMKNVKVTKSSGNVFADLGLPNADEHLVKAEIVLGIADRVKTRGLTQAQVAKLIGLAQPDVSKLLRGNFAGYSFERLFGFLRALGNDVEIKVIATKKQKEGHLHLEMA
jgi:phage-related protein